MSIRKIDIPLFLCFALFLYPVIIGKIALVCYLVLYGVAFIYLLFNTEIVSRFLKIPSRQFIVICSIFVMLLCSILHPIFMRTYDFSYVNEIMAIFRKCLIILSLIVMIIKRENGRPVFETFCFYFCVLQCAYVISTMIFLVISPLKDFWKVILSEPAFKVNLYDSYGYAARFGWMGFSGYRSTIDCSLGIVFANYLYSRKDKLTSISTLLYFTFLFMCFLGNMFYARTGIIASAIVMILGIFAYHNIKPKYFIIFIFCGISLVLILLLLRTKIPFIDEWLTWAFKPFYYMITGQRETGHSSMNVIKDRMLFLPEIATLMHGDGYFTDPITNLYYGRTDLGFMRQLLFWGVPGLLLTYGTTFFSILSMKKDIVLNLMLAICVVIFEFKGDMYYEVLPVFFLLGICNKSSHIIKKSDYCIRRINTQLNLGFFD